MKKVIRVGARSSPLSKVQAQEVLTELRRYHPEVEFDFVYLETTGDKDKKTSLRTLDRTDFFTKEIDQLLLAGKCDVGIHSAKDLPEPMPKGLVVAAFTKGVDSSDSLVLKSGMTLETLPPGARIATSSVRREEQVKQLRPDLSFVDLRGTIGERLSKLEQGEVEGVVIAEAALIRLGWTHLNRTQLPGESTPRQGQLAIVVREDDREMKELFQVLDHQKIALHTGLEAYPTTKERNILHCPLIQIVPRPYHNLDIREAFMQLPTCTHLLFTSKNAVRIFFSYLPHFHNHEDILQNKKFIAVGSATAGLLQEHGFNALYPEQESAEGIVQLLETLDLKNSSFFWPHAAGSRPVLSDFFVRKRISCAECILYDTKTRVPSPLPDLSKIDEIIFTSPSTIDAFIEIFGALPEDKTLICIGPVTQKRLSAKDSLINS